MKKLLLSILFFCLGFLAFGQGNVVIFEENARPFTLIVNGIAQNMTPSPNIKLTNISVEMLTIEIRFENGAAAQRTIMSTQGLEISYQIKRNHQTGSPFIYFEKEIPLAQSLTYRNQLVIAYQQNTVIMNNNNNNQQYHDKHQHQEKVIIIETITMDN